MKARVRREAALRPLFSLPFLQCGHWERRQKSGPRLREALVVKVLIVRWSALLGSPPIYADHLPKPKDAICYERNLIFVYLWRRAALRDVPAEGANSGIMNWQVSGVWQRSVGHRSEVGAPINATGDQGYLGDRRPESFVTSMG